MTTDWSKLKSFYFAAVCGSFTAAAEKMFVTQPSISRQITNLEERFGVLLFHRTSRGLMLTEQGKMLFKAVQKMRAIYEKVETEFRDDSDQISGTFRLIVASHLISSNYFLKILSKFTASNPNVKIYLYNSGVNNGWIPGADAAIAPANNLTDNLNYEHLVSLNPSIWAGKKYYSYIKKFEKSNDYPSRHLIAYLENLPYSRLYNWHIHNNISDKKSYDQDVSLWLSNVDETINAVAQNFGIGSFPRVFLPDNLKDELVCLNSPNRKGPTVDLYYIYPMENASSKRVRIMSMFLKQIMDEFFNNDSMHSKK